MGKVDRDLDLSFHFLQRCFCNRGRISITPVFDPWDGEGTRGPVRFIIIYVTSKNFQTISILSLLNGTQVGKKMGGIRKSGPSGCETTHKSWTTLVSLLSCIRIRRERGP